MPFVQGFRLRRRMPALMRIWPSSQIPSRMAIASAVLNPIRDVLG